MGKWNFSYDAVDRLTSAAAGSNAPTAFQGQSAAWSYDSYGNRTAQTFTNNVYSNWANYNPANNRITAATSAVAGYVYDASGNTLYDGNHEYWYDAEGQLCAVAPTNSYGYPSAPYTGYIYDAEGARIAKGTLSAPPAPYTLISANLASSPLCAPPLGAPPLGAGFTLTARYLVDQGGNQVTELSEQGLPTPATEIWAHSNVFYAARLTATYDVKYINGINTGGLHYELADPLGTKRVQANISGQIEMSWASLPFGDALTPILPPNPPPTADDATEHHFTQKERDNESGNDYFFARYYNTAIGRFTTPDWSAKVVPVPYAQMGDPQSFNLYAYVRNNPIIHVDLDGHQKPCNSNDWGCNPWSANSAQNEARRAAQGWPQQQAQQQNNNGNAVPKPDHFTLNMNGWANPTGHVERGCDTGGCGNYGASRRDVPGVPTHRGADYLGTVGQDVYALHTGFISSIGYAYPNSSLRMIHISTYDGYSIGVGYASPASGIRRGSFVVAGESIGIMQNVQDVVGRRTPPHIHIQIDFNGTRINPESLIPTPFRMTF